MEGYHRDYKERIHQLCASRYGPQLDTARMREIQDDLEQIERGLDTLQKTLDEIVKCYAACEKKARERGAIGNLDKGIPQGERVLKNAVDVYGKILDQGESFAQGFWDEIVSQGSRITEGFGTIFTKLFYCIPGSDNLSKLFGLDSTAIQKWADGNTEAYKAGLTMLIEHPILVFTAMLEEWKKTYEEKGPAYIAGRLGCDSFIAILESATTAKIAGEARNMEKKINPVVDAGKTRSSVEHKTEDVANLAKQVKKASEISKETTDAVKQVTKPKTPGDSSNMQKDFKGYAGKVKDVGGESDSASVIKNIQSKSPQQLIEDGWEDITNPKMATNTNSREFYDPKSGLKIRFDKGVDGANGFEAVDHYHVINPNYTNKKVDYYLDIDGKPVGKGSKASHIVIKGEE